MKITRRNFVKLSGISLPSLASFKFGRIEVEDPAPTSSKQGPPESWVELNLSNIGWNLERIRNHAKQPILAVIKANAYGHGLEEIGQYLCQKGVHGLMVCKLQEAISLRNAGISCPVFNFGPFLPSHSEALLDYNIIPFISSPEVADLNQAARKRKKTARIHIHVDTGMNRMGVSYRAASSFIKNTSLLECIHIAGVSTTLTEDEEYDKVLLNRFLSVCSEAEKAGVAVGLKHAASSAGILTSQEYHLDMVRPGIMLYGHYPNQTATQEDPLSLKPALQLKTRVVEVKSLRPGDSVSYHRAFVAQKDEKIAVLPIGYSDGYPPAVAGKGAVLIKGEKFPVIARITANHTAVLLTENSVIEPGNEVVLIGSQGKTTISADEVAGWSGISNYKVLIGLNPSLHRKTNP